jgi:hypothetical protein
MLARSYLRQRMEEALEWTPLLNMTPELLENLRDPLLQARLQANERSRVDAYDAMVSECDVFLKRREEVYREGQGIIHAPGMINNPAMRQPAASLSPLSDDNQRVKDSGFLRYLVSTLKAFLLSRNRPAYGIKPVLCLRILNDLCNFDDVSAFALGAHLAVPARDPLPVQPVVPPAINMPVVPAVPVRPVVPPAATSFVPVVPVSPAVAVPVRPVVPPAATSFVPVVPVSERPAVAVPVRPVVPPPAIPLIFAGVPVSERPVVPPAINMPVVPAVPVRPVPPAEPAPVVHDVSVSAVPAVPVPVGPALNFSEAVQQEVQCDDCARAKRRRTNRSSTSSNHDEYKCSCGCDVVGSLADMEKCRGNCGPDVYGLRRYHSHGLCSRCLNNK